MHTKISIYPYKNNILEWFAILYVCYAFFGFSAHVILFVNIYWFFVTFFFLDTDTAKYVEKQSTLPNIWFYLILQ